jgi:hypothetical protein
MTAASTRNRRPIRKTLALERLESRELLAGDVHVGLQGQMLVIWGDDADNSVVLTYNSTNQTYQVHGRDAGGSMTLINGLDTTQPGNVVEFGGVREIAVLLNGGNDRFEVGSPEAVDTVINKWLSIDMGDGDDEVILGRAGNAPGGADPVATRLRTGTSINVNLGNGDDRLEVANLDVGLHFNVFAGEGDDEIVFATEFTPTGAQEPELAVVRVRGNSTINLGPGDDTLDVRHAVFHNHLRILDGAGPADISMHNVNVRQKLEINTGNDADTVALDYVYAKTFGLNTNGGADDVDLRNCRFKTLSIKLGAGRDKLLLRNVKVTWITTLDGGPQGSALTRGPGNQLRRISQRNFS